MSEKNTIHPKVAKADAAYQEAEKMELKAEEKRSYTYEDKLEHVRQFLAAKERGDSEEISRLSRAIELIDIAIDMAARESFRKSKIREEAQRTAISLRYAIEASKKALALANDNLAGCKDDLKEAKELLKSAQNKVLEAEEKKRIALLNYEQLTK